MGAAIGLREDFGSAELRVLARTVKDAGQARRLLALAVIYDGGRGNCPNPRRKWWQSLRQQGRREKRTG